MIHNTCTFAGHGGTRLHAQSWQSDSPAQANLLIVHGIGEHSGRYDEFARRLTQQKINVFAFDLRGHGQSEGQRGHVRQFEEFRNDVAGSLSHVVHPVAKDRPTFLFGHSLGGLIGLDQVLRCGKQFSGAIISAPALDTGGVSKPLILLSKALSWIWPNLTIKTGIDVTAISRDPDVIARYQNDSLVHHVGTPRMATEAMSAMKWCMQPERSLSIPLLMIHGSADRITSPAVSRRFFDQLDCDNKKYILYDGGFHESHNDIHRDQVVIDIVQFVATICCS